MSGASGGALAFLKAFVPGVVARGRVDAADTDRAADTPEQINQRVRDEVASTMPVRVLSITPVQTVGQQDGEHGPRLFARDPDACCALRKVEPLERALSGYDAWATGVRRGETAARATAREVDFDGSRGKVKVSPIVGWSDADVAAYIERYDVPVNALFSQGYGSIGCWPCTRKVKPGEDPRAGRWAMFDKTECGLHQ